MFKTIISCCLLFFSQQTLAATNNNSLDTIIELFHTQTKLWEPIITQHIWGLFWGLVTISFAWSFIQLVLKEGGWVDVIALAFNNIMTIGFAVYVIQNATYLAWALIGSFNKIAGILSNSQEPFSPSNVFELGLSLVDKIIENIGAFAFGDAIVMGISALIVLVLFAMIAAEMTVLIVGSFMLVSGGIVMLGFLGSQWTRDYGMNYITSVIGMGVQLFMMQLVVLIGYNVFTSFVDTGSGDNAASLMLVGLTVVYYALIRTIPSIATSLATGHFRFTSGAAVAAAASVASAAAGIGLLAGGVAASAGNQAVSKFMNSSKGASLLSKFSTISNQAAGYSPTTFAASKAAGAMASVAKVGASVGGKVAKAGLQALANQSTVGRALSSVSSSGGGHNAVKKAMGSASTMAQARQNQSQRNVGKAMMNEL